MTVILERKFLSSVARISSTGSTSPCDAQSPSNDYTVVREAASSRVGQVSVVDMPCRNHQAAAHGSSKRCHFAADRGLGAADASYPETLGVFHR